MLKKHGKFLGVLWSFVICSFVFFQNFTQDLNSTALHNDACKQALDLNQSRILSVNAAHADLLAAWPRNTVNIDDSINSLTMVLLESNQQIYGSCLAEAMPVKESQTFALAELKKISDPEVNKVWKKYVSVIDESLKNFKGVSR